MQKETEKRIKERELSEETIEAIERLCLFDDDFMSLVFEKNKEATEYLINTILEREDLKVLEVNGQRSFKNPYVDGRTITIDIYAKDLTGKVYDIEVQRSDAGAVPSRARFHSAMMDVRMLKEGQDFKEIKDSYVIFITQNDVLRKGLPLYHVDKMIRETMEDFKDGAHIIYVNGAYKNDENPIGRLVHDLGCVRAADMYNDVLKKQMTYYKETRGGQSEMCEIVEQAAEKIAVKMAERMAKDMAEDMAKDIAENMAKDMAENMAKDIAENMAKDIAENMAKDIAENMAKDMAENMLKDMVEEQFQEISTETHIEDLVNGVKNLMKNANMTAEVALDVLEVDENERQIILSRMY